MITVTMLSQSQDRAESNSSSRVSNQLTGFMLPRAQPFPLKCLKIRPEPPLPALVPHWVGMWPLTRRFSASLGRPVAFFVLHPCRGWESSTEMCALWAIKEWERGRSAVVCISSSYTSKKSWCSFVYFDLTCVVRLFKVENSK